jgi:hypothetical protein
MTSAFMEHECRHPVHTESCPESAQPSSHVHSSHLDRMKERKMDTKEILQYKLKESRDRCRT